MNAGLPFIDIRIPFSNKFLFRCYLAVAVAYNQSNRIIYTRNTMCVCVCVFPVCTVQCFTQTNTETHTQRPYMVGVHERMNEWIMGILNGIFEHVSCSCGLLGLSPMRRAFYVCHLYIYLCLLRVFHKFYFLIVYNSVACSEALAKFGYNVDGGHRQYWSVTKDSQATNSIPETK